MRDFKLSRADVRATLAFVGAWMFLNAMANLRYPDKEPAFWYVGPSLDVFVIFAYLASFGFARKSVPTWLRITVVLWFLLTRLMRFGDGIQQQFFAQPFNLYSDLPLIPELVRFGYSTLTGWKVALLVLLTPATLAGLSWAIHRALLQAERYLARSRNVGIFLGLSAASFAVVLGTHPPYYPNLYLGGFGSSIAPRLRHELKFIYGVYAGRAARDGAIAAVERRLEQKPHALDKLHGRNVYLILVESYGQTVFERPAFVRATRETYDSFERELGDRGFSIVSGVMDSPTYGGHSWLAHATLGTGVWTTNQLEFELVLSRKPKAIARFFEPAGYRTVLVQPGTTRPWPKGEFYGFEQRYYLWNFDYHGPSYAWATMPDQFVLDFLRRRELEVPQQRPLFVECVLVSSHAPWSQQPEVVEDWSTLGNGDVYNHLRTVRYAIRWPKFENAASAYIRSINYDFDVMRRFFADYVKDGSLIIILGDHQPVAEVNGHTDSHAVPVHVLSRDAALLQPFVARGYTPGMRPKRGAHVARMDQFLPNLLSDYSSGPTARR